jgi:arylsulfatase A-like enzyme
MLKDAQAPGKDVSYTVVSRGKDLGRAIRDQRWRYARWPDGEELFDLENDIEEHHNLAKSPERAGTLQSMRKLLADAEKKAASQRKR